MNSKLYRRPKKRVKKTAGGATGASHAKPGTLYVVSGPLGNLEDITLRALRVLQEVSIVAAEDASSTQRLLSHYGLRAILTTYDHQNHREKAEILIDRLRKGQDVALVSDCGTPVIYDPGSWLVRRAVDEDIPVRSIPGPSLPTTALAVAGMSGDAFLFQGLLPRSSELLQQFFESVEKNRRTLVFFVSPDRLRSTMHLLGKYLGNRHVLVAADLTKTSERLIRGTVSRLLQTDQLALRDADITVVVEGFRRKVKPR